MTTAAEYILLNFDDKDQDALLANNIGLLNNIDTIIKDNTNKINQELSNIRYHILQLQNSLITTLDNSTYITIKANIEKLTKELESKIEQFNIISTPSFDQIRQSHFIFMNTQYKPFVECSFNYIKESINSKPTYGSSVDIPISVNGDFLSDMVLHVQLSELRPISSTDKVRYADFLGHKLIKTVQLIINNIKIDEYTGEFYNAYYNTLLPDGKKKAWLECVGQETPVEAMLIQDPVNDNYREKKWICSGNQTLKSSHSDVDLYIPLLFWFNVNKNEMFLNNFPFGSVVIRVEIEESTNIMTCLDVENDLYHEGYITPTINEFEIYANHIYINNDVRDIFIARLGFTLIRTHIQVNRILNQDNDSISLSADLKYPIEDLIVYARPGINETGIDSLNLWHKNSVQIIRNIPVPVIYNSSGAEQLGINNISYYDEKPLFDHINISIDNTSNHGSNTPAFYQSYVPLVSGKHIYSNNNNVYYMPYNLYPRKYQPSGYVNMTKSRRIYFEYSSSLVGAFMPVNLYVHAHAVNFIVYDGKKCMLNFNQ